MKGTMARTFVGVLMAVIFAIVSMAVSPPHTSVAATTNASMTSAPNVDTGGPSSE